MKKKIAAGLAVFALLGILGAACGATTPPAAAWPLSCEHEAGDAKCALCVKASCCAEATACKSSTGCECLTRCYANPPPLKSADLSCPRRCEGVADSFKAMRACVDAHCADACSGGAS